MLKKIINYLFMKNEMSGVDIINRQISQFKSIVDNLTDGIDLIDEDIVSNQEKIHALKSENKVLGDKKVEALAFKHGLTNLLSGRPQE